MAELTRKQAKESGMLGDYAHMFDLKRLGDQVIDEIPDTSNFATTHPPRAATLSRTRW